MKLRVFSMSGLLVSLVLLLGLSLPSAATAQWDGAAWADDSQYLSPITATMKAHLRSILAHGVEAGRVEGRMGQIGDSITESSAYFRNVVLYGADPNETGHDYDPIRSWLAYGGEKPADANSFYRDHGKETPYGNRGGWRLANAVGIGHPRLCVEEGDGTTPGDFSWAVVMFGTNDINPDDWKPSVWKEQYRDFLEGFIDLGVIPVLSTIPPSERHVDDGRVDLANQQIKALASELQIPLIDFYAYIVHYQPDNWTGTLISDDGIHPSAGGGGVDFSRDGLTASDGYAARSKLTLDMAEKLERIVFDDGTPDEGAPLPEHSMGAWKAGYSSASR